MAMLSVVWPVYKDSLYFDEIINTYQQAELGKHEILVVGEGLSTEQVQALDTINAKYLEVTAATRAERLQVGIDHAKGEIILLQHPRSVIEVEGMEALARMTDKIWGGFYHRFDDEHGLLKFTSFWSNQVRRRTQKILYLDHCIFFHRDLWHDYTIPPIDVFEDSEISKHLAQSGAPVLLPYESTTSAVRFQKNGYARQSLMNQIMKLGYWLNVSPERMNKIYEKGLNLNSESV
jgi:hypothetical protein